VLSGEDRGDELRVGVAPTAEIAGNGLGVKRHTTLSNGHVMAVVFEEKPVREAVGTRQPRAARVKGADPVNATIRRRMSMAADDEFSAGSGKQLPELLIVDPRLDPRAVVGDG
jgi:hypothetical protein